MIKDGFYDIDTLKEKYGLQTEAEWYEALDELGDQDITKIRKLINSGEDLTKNPRIKITAITIINFAQNPPGSEFKNSRTRSSPPNALKAAVSTAAPKRIINTSEVVFAVSNITSFKVPSIL